MNKIKLIKNLNGRKAELTVQTIFFVLMSIIFISILIFGFQKMLDVQKNLSETERLEIKTYMKNSFEYCEDPLNKGNFKTFEIKNELFNAICIIGEDIKNPNSDYSQYEDFLTLYETGQNLVIFDTSYKIVDSKYEFVNYFIIDSLKLDSSLKETKCYVKNDEKNLIEVKISCD